MKGVTMSKKQHHHKIVSLDTRQSILRMLRKDFSLTESEIELVTRAVEHEVPADIAEYMQACIDGKVTLKHNPTIRIDMGDGSFMDMKFNNHPVVLLSQYLDERFGKDFGTVYWFACTDPTPERFLQSLNFLKRAPFFADARATLKNRSNRQGEESL